MKRIWKLALPLVLAAAVALAALNAGAVWDEDRAVHIQPDGIESATLAIGTHLVYLGSLTDSIYEIAQDSAEESGQDLVYYKSELAGGTWFDITAAETLVDITTGGTPVTPDVIAALFFTHHTKSDGVTYDLRTGEAVSAFDIRDPYELESLEELFPLKTQYDLIGEQQSGSVAGKAKLARIEEIFAMDVHTAAANALDRDMAALQAYYDVLAANDGGAAEMEAVQAVQQAVDAARRYGVFAMLEPALTAYSEELSAVSDQTDEEGNTSEGASPDTSLQSAVSDSLTNVGNSLIEQEGKMLGAGTTLSSQVNYALSQDLINDANKPDHAACDVDVKRLIALGNIMDSLVADKGFELSLLNERLLGPATDRYLALLGEGENAEYRAAVAANSAAALLRGISRTNEGELNALRAELEFIIEARCLRVTDREALDFINARLEEAVNYYAKAPDDGFKSGADTTVDAHIDFLSRKKAALEAALGGSEIDKLTAERDDLKNKYMDALDNNDLAGAKDLSGRISGLNDQITALQNADALALANMKDDLNDLENQLADANANGDGALADDLSGRIANLKKDISVKENGMSDGSLGDIVTTLKLECLGIIDTDGDRDLLYSDIDTLCGMLETDTKAVFPALREIYAALLKGRDVDGMTGLDDDILLIENAILDNKSAYDASMRTELTAGDLERIAREYFDGLDGTSALLAKYGADGEGVVFLLALDLYYADTQSGAAAGLLVSRGRREYGAGNALVFLQADDVTMEFAPLTAIEAYTGLRYVWNANTSLATLARGATYYSFTLYSDVVSIGRTAEETETMLRAAKYLDARCYIPEDYCLAKFACEAVYLAGTDYGALSSDGFAALAEELYTLFLEG